MTQKQSSYLIRFSFSGWIDFDSVSFRICAKNLVNAIPQYRSCCKSHVYVQFTELHGQENDALMSNIFCLKSVCFF